MVKFANASTMVSWRGESVVLAVDQVWHADDPFVVDRPDLFSDLPTFVHRTNGHQPGVVQLPATGTRRRGSRG